jgi:hypothetical protein
MKILTLNGDWAIATTALAQFYKSFAWDHPNALTSFDFGIEQAFFDSLEKQFGAHERISEHKVEWRDGTDTITFVSISNTLLCPSVPRTLSGRKSPIRRSVPKLKE